MNIKIRAIKTATLLAMFALYISLILSDFGTAEPSGASLTPINVDTGPNATPGSRTDAGATITTLDLSVTQQNPGWKGYIGNITGTLVLRNSNGYSIYEWAIASATLSGNIFVTRSNSINWTPIRCANNTNIVAEDAALGLSSSASDSINKTFNYSIHKSMTISGVGTIAADSCNSTATYLNNTFQGMNATTTKFQEILLSDTVNLVYGTYIDQDSWGFDGLSNITHDFQLIVAENKTSAIGSTYYFYADIS